MTGRARQEPTHQPGWAIAGVACEVDPKEKASEAATPDENLSHPSLSAQPRTDQL